MDHRVVFCEHDMVVALKFTAAVAACIVPTQYWASKHTVIGA